MSEATRIRKNSLFSLISSFLRLVANFILFWLVAKRLGPEVFGQFTLAHTLATIWILFADFGFDVLLTTEIARDRANAAKLFRQYFSLKLVFAVAALIAMWIFVFLKDLSQASRLLIFIFSFFMLFSALNNFFFAFYKGFEKLEYETKVTLYINLGLVLLVLGMIQFDASVYLIAATFTLSRFVGLLLGIYYAKKVLTGISYALWFHGLGDIAKKVLIFGFHLLFNNLYFQIDTILLGFWKGDHDVGIYQSVFKLILLPLVLPDVLTNALMPALARFNVENPARWERVGFLMTKLLSFIVIPISLICFVYATQIVDLLYGLQNYREAVPVLQILSLTLFIRFTFEAYALLLTTSGRQHVRMIVVICVTVLNVLLNSFLIPRYGALGAAMVSLICNACVGLAYGLVSARLFVHWSLNSRMIVVYLLTAGSATLLWSFRTVTMAIGIPLLLLLFCLIAYVYFFTKDEKAVMFSLDFGFVPFRRSARTTE